MTDIWPVAELDQPASRSVRAMPALAVTIALLLVAAVAAAVLGLGDGDRTPSQRLAAAPGAVEDAGTFVYELTIDTAVGDADTSSIITGSVDAEARRSSSKIAVAGFDVEFVLDGDLLYVHLPEAARAQNGGKGWVRVDAGALTQRFGGINGGANSPLDSIRQLAGSADVEEVGKEKVRGADTTHFRAVLDLSKSFGAGAQAALPAQERALYDQLKTVPVDVWLDDDDRVRRQRTTIELSIPGLLTGASTQVVTTMETFDYGKPVDIEIPSPDDVTESSSLTDLGALLGDPTAPD